MKGRFVALSIFAFALLIGCSQDEIQLPDQKLSGTVASEEWEIKFANAYLISSDLKYRIQFLSSKESGEDPCAIPSPGNPFVSMEIPLQRGSFSVPFPNINESPRFHVTNSSALNATSGFLEIYDVVNSRITGYLQAILDENNSVEGYFEVIICN